MSDAHTTRRARKELARAAKQARKQARRVGSKARAAGDSMVGTVTTQATDTAAEVADVVAEVSRRAAKLAAKAERKAGKTAKITRRAARAQAKDVKAAAKVAAKRARKTAKRDKGGHGKRRLLLLFVGSAVAAGTVYVVRARAAKQETPSATVTPLDPDRASTNGVLPEQGAHRRADDTDHASAGRPDHRQTGNQN